MNTLQLHSVVERFIQETWGRCRFDTVDELAHVDLKVYYPVMAQPANGRAAFKNLLAGHHSVFSDIELTVDQIFSADEQAAVRWTQRVTHCGTLMGLAATGKRITFTGITLYRMRQGKIVDERGEEDFDGILRQLKA